MFDMITVPTAPDRYAGIPEVVDAIGDNVFGSQLLKFLYRICGAEHCTVYRLSADDITKIAAASIDGTDVAHKQVALYFENHRWHRDPMMSQMRERLTIQPSGILHTAVNEISDYDVREVVYGRMNICDRLLLCERSSDGIVGLSLLRSGNLGAFSGSDIDRLCQVATTMLAMARKHVGRSLPMPDLSLALTSLSEIEACLADASIAFSPREAQVCARIIYGVSSTGIALELGIGEETVMTYRKRAYQRLGIATQRELIVWYIDLWNARHLQKITH